MSTANSHDWFRLARVVCMALAIIFVAAAGLFVLRGVQTAFQNADQVTNQSMDQVAQEFIWPCQLPCWPWTCS